MRQAPVPSGTIIAIAGNGTLGFAGDGGQAIDASFSDPSAIVVGGNGTLYISDVSNNRIRAINPASGIVSTVAGNGSYPVGDGPHGDGGTATSAQIGDVFSLAIDRESNTLYLPQWGFYRVRQVNLVTGIIDNFAGIGQLGNPPGWQDGDDGPATLAYLVLPFGAAVGPYDQTGDVYITDWHRVRRVDGTTGIIHRVAGIEDQDGQPVTTSGGDGGPAIEASFTFPYRLRVDGDGDVFVIDLADAGHIVRHIDAATGIITRIAGGGTNPPTAGSTATDVNLGNVLDVAPDDAGNLYISNDNQIFKLTLATGQISPFAGSETAGFSGDGGPAIDALFSNINGLAAVPGGGLLVADTNNVRVRYIAPESINLVGDAGLTEFHLPWVSALTGSVTISDNPNVTVISLGGLGSVTGVVSVTGNSATGVVDLGSLETIGGAVSVTSNQGTGFVDLGALQTVTGNVTITDNGNATVSVGSLESVTGNVTLESTGTGTFSTASANVTGNVDLNLDGYTTVAASTGGGSTVVTMIDNEATMEVTLPDGAFTSATPVGFSITNLTSGGTETVDGETVTHLASYAFDFAIPTLNSAAELNFEIDLAVLDEPSRLLLLDLVDQSAELTLCVLGDAPGSELQLFDVCAGGGPVADACVVVEWLDETRMLLDPLGVTDPAFLRLEGLVGHFSTYSFVAVGLAGDYNLDGTVNAADYTVWRNSLGQTGNGLAADGNRNGQIDSGDYDVWKRHFGQTGSGPGAAVPEPGSAILFLMGLLLIGHRFLERGIGRRSARSATLRPLYGGLTRQEVLADHSQRCCQETSCVH